MLRFITLFCVFGILPILAQVSAQENIEQSQKKTDILSLINQTKDFCNFYIEWEINGIVYPLFDNRKEAEDYVTNYLPSRYGNRLNQDKKIVEENINKVMNTQKGSKTNCLLFGENNNYKYLQGRSESDSRYINLINYHSILITDYGDGFLNLSEKDNRTRRLLPLFRTESYLEDMLKNIDHTSMTKKGDHIEKISCDLDQHSFEIQYNDPTSDMPTDLIIQSDGEISNHYIYKNYISIKGCTAPQEIIWNYYGVHPVKGNRYLQSTEIWRSKQFKSLTTVFDKDLGYLVPSGTLIQNKNQNKSTVLKAPGEKEIDVIEWIKKNPGILSDKRLFE